MSSSFKNFVIRSGLQLLVVVYSSISVRVWLLSVRVWLLSKVEFDCNRLVVVSTQLSIENNSIYELAVL